MTDDGRPDYEAHVNAVTANADQAQTLEDAVAACQELRLVLEHAESNADRYAHRNCDAYHDASSDAYRDCYAFFNAYRDADQHTNTSTDGDNRASPERSGHGFRQ